MTMPIRVSTTRISISVIPRIAATRLETFGRATSRCEWFCMITLSPGQRRPDRLDSASDGKFAHSHDAKQNREHDSTDKHRESEYQHRLENREKTLHRDLYLAVVDLGDAVEHLLESAGFLADQNHLGRQSRVDPRC